MFYLGDTHGNLNYVKWFIDNRKIRNTDIIHVGDYGVGFIGDVLKERNLMDKFNKWLHERELTMHVFRGNHDDPYYFNGDFVYDNLKFHPDYTVLEIEGKRILGVGGALSIDRVVRRKWNLTETRYGTQKRFHWYDEKFILDIEKLNEIKDIDIVVTHTAPDFVYPVNKNNNWPPVVAQFFPEDPGLANDLIEERALLTEFYNIVTKNNPNITHHIYGHFHTHNIDVVGNCTHICLEINQLYEIPDYTDYEKELNEKYGE